MKYKPIIMFISLRFEGGQHEIQTTDVFISLRFEGGQHEIQTTDVFISLNSEGGPACQGKHLCVSYLPSLFF
jgi:hypothetical protein